MNYRDLKEADGVLRRMDQELCHLMGTSEAWCPDGRMSTYHLAAQMNLFTLKAGKAAAVLCLMGQADPNVAKETLRQLVETAFDGAIADLSAPAGSA